MRFWLSGLWNCKQAVGLRFFNVFFRFQKKWLFTFFELLHTFSRTLLAAKGRVGKTSSIEHRLVPDTERDKRTNSGLYLVPEQRYAVVGKKQTGRHQTTRMHRWTTCMRCGLFVRTSFIWNELDQQDRKSDKKRHHLWQTGISTGIIFVAVTNCNTDSERWYR